MKPATVVLLLACVLAVLPAGASGAAAADKRGLLLVNYLGGGGGIGERGGWVSWIVVNSEDSVARVTLTTPSGYPVTLDHAPGAVLGHLQARIAAGEGESDVWFIGDLVVESASRYASDPTAEGCAPGAHAAVWRVDLAGPATDPERGPRQTFELPIFVDRAAAGGSLVLRFCPIWQTSRGAMAAKYLELTIEGVFGRLTARGWNTWHALVSPPLPTLAPDEPRTFELRAHEPMPHSVAVEARHDAAKGIAVVSGRVTAVGTPESGVELAVFASREWATQVPGVGTARTNAAGEFSFRHRARQSTVYIVTGLVEPRACGEPSSAPAGCASETVSAPPIAAAVARIRRPNDAKLVMRSRDQALASGIGLKLADLPTNWREGGFFSGHRCRAFNPNLTRLTATGWAESGRFERHDAGASSRVTVYASDAHARTAFEREARLEAAQCLAGERGSASAVRGVRAIELPAVGDERRAFRIVLRDERGRYNLDLISFRRGRAVVHLGFEDVLQRVERAVAAKLAARARRA